MPQHSPFKSSFFLSGVLIIAILSLFLLWTTRNRGPEVYLSIIIAMLAVGSIQGAYVLLWLVLEERSRSFVNVNVNIPMNEPELNDSSDDD